MKQSLTKLMAILVVLSFNGCTTHEGPTYGEQVLNDDKQTVFKLNSVAILDKNLQQWEYNDLTTGHNTKSKISVENLGIRSLDTGNVEVFTTIRNRTDYPLQLDIRSQFYDDNQIATEVPSVWKRTFLSKNSVLTYKEKSITTFSVTNFLIEVKEGE